MMPVWLALLLVALFGFVCGGGGAFVFWAFVTGDLRRQIARLEEIRDLQSAEVAIRDHALYVAHRFDRLEGATAQKQEPPMRRCGAWSLGYEYRCTLPPHHRGPHREIRNDGETYVEWNPPPSEVEKASERFQEGTRRLRATERDRYPQ